MNSHAESTKEWHLDRIKSEIDRKSGKRLWWRETEREREIGAGLGWSRAVEGMAFCHSG